jgi:hypothetical protein
MTEISTPTGEGLVDETRRAHRTARAGLGPLPAPTPLWLLMLIYVVSFLDRQVINILAEPIKNELQPVRHPAGPALRLRLRIVYTFLGFPLARAADRYNRPWIIAGCLTAWSGFTIACGLAPDYCPAGSSRGRRRRRRGRLQPRLPRPDRRLHAQGEARLGARLLRHGHADRLAARPGAGRLPRRHLRLAPAFWWPACRA